MMKNYVNNHIKIFELCKRLAILLGDKEAIADLKLLYERHPEMFKDIKEISHVINEVVKDTIQEKDTSKEHKSHRRSR